MTIISLLDEKLDRGMSGTQLWRSDKDLPRELIDTCPGHADWWYNTLGTWCNVSTKLSSRRQSDKNLPSRDEPSAEIG